MTIGRGWRGQCGKDSRVAAGGNGRGGQMSTPMPKRPVVNAWIIDCDIRAMVTPRSVGDLWEDSADRTRSLLALSVLVVCLASLAGCGSGANTSAASCDTPGVSADEVKLGLMIPDTGGGSDPPVPAWRRDWRRRTRRAASTGAASSISGGMIRVSRPPTSWRVANWWSSRTSSACLR
ncbi:hypothetical protein FAGKG844_640014 [Frankia sp. AgKG'84/4]